MARVESEAGIIATLIHHPEFSYYSEQLLPNHFTNEENRYIYQAICSLARDGITTIDPYNIIQALSAKEATRRFADELSIDQLYTLMDNSDSIARNTVEEYKLLVNNVMDAAFRRDTFQQLKECQKLCTQPSEENIEQKIYKMLDDVMMEFSATNEVPPYKDVVDKCWEEIKGRQGAGYAGIPFKFPALNDYATIERGELFIFGAEQKQGKSMMLLNCAVDLLKQDYAVLYLDSELNTRLFTSRILAHLSGIEYKRLTSGNYSDEEEKRILDAKEWLKTRKFTHIYIPMFDQQSIFTAVNKVKHTQGLDVLIVDYFKGKGEGDAFDSYQELGRFVDMVKNQILVLDHNYGLWYERRRDDHERVRRRDGDVWGPFYEQPFARSGEGTAWEGLSKYDLNRPNAWYWNRLKQFAEKGAEKGLLLFHENYFQHNILEAGAHWVDCPWRSANNINQTDMPEPVPFAGDKRIFVADMFYDISHPVRREFHRKYIRQCLDNFADDANVVQLISAEFTGPLHFVQFWLDVIGEWEKETGKKATVALSATKDVQDAILNDTQRAKLVDIIDIRYWHYKVDGLYAPEGGKNLAPRQHARKMKVGKVTFDEAYRAVSEYRKKFPEKAVTYYAQNYPDMAWAVFMASGSCSVVPVADESFLTDAAAMDMEDTGTNKYQKLVKSGIGSIIYSHSATDIPVHLSPGKYILKSVDPKTGAITVIAKRLNIKDIYMLKAEENKDCIYWFHRI